MNAPPPGSLLIEPERHALLPPHTAPALDATLVLAPHPDDESLGCGGLLALLAESGRRVRVLFVTDGSRSHPQSRTHPAARLAEVREAEARAALAELGVPADAARFLRFRDCGLPAENAPAFPDAVAQFHKAVADFAPDTLLVPWRRDPHCDHAATWRLARAAVSTLSPAPRWLEYPVWAWAHATGDAAPREDEADAWRLDISPVLPRKQQAIAQHRSQLGGLIHDDAEGFVLAPAMLAHFAMPWELFLEPKDG